MNFEMQQAVQLLVNLLWLSNVQTTAVDKVELDALLSQLFETAMGDVDRLTVDFVAEVEARRLRIIAAQEQAARDVIAAEQQAEKDAVQGEADEKQRVERLRLGVS